MKKRSSFWKGIFTLKAEKIDIWDYILIKLTAVTVTLTLIKLFLATVVLWLVSINISWFIGTLVFLVAIIFMKRSLAKRFCSGKE